MIDQRLRLRHLRCFLEVARLGSLSAAANNLRISQPAVSKTIKELEEILGRALFDRSRRRLALSQEGRVFQQHAGAGMIALERAQRLVMGDAVRTRRIAAGVLPTAATDLMPRAALAFHREFPNCLLRVSTGPNWLLMSQLREGALDLVVGRIGSAKVMEGLTFRPLYADPIGAIVRPGHPLLAQSGTPDFESYPLVLPPPGAVISQQVRAMLTRLSAPVGAHAFETVSLAFGRRLVEKSDAIWFISCGVVARELEIGSLMQLPLPLALDGPPVGISMREDGEISREVDGLLDALAAASIADKDLPKKITSGIGR